ncbi:MAG: biotin synthase BioB [Vallitalea sp.]|jgi:biotin synthase|nr:biotin synthase BioB [Vallitalea sp.]
MEYIKNKIIKGYDLKKKEAVELYKGIDTERLYEIANDVRKFFMGNKVSLCTIMNAKSGQCSEDCKYCAQSSHYETNIEEYPLISKEDAITRAKENISYGVNHFSLVTSGKGLIGKDFEKIIDIYKELSINFPELKLCASHGIISYDQAKKLKEAGVTTYHHNLESSKRFYKEICTTHSYNDRVNTILNAQKAGLSVCSGGIIGMGETIFDRINMAYELKKLKIKSIPINILKPVKGTPYEHKNKLKPEEILKTIAIFRLILPKAYIRFAGGRSFLGKYEAKGFEAGVNGALVGNYLTTIGNKIEEDIEMIKEMGFEIL